MGRKEIGNFEERFPSTGRGKKKGGRWKSFVWEGSGTSPEFSLLAEKRGKTDLTGKGRGGSLFTGGSYIGGRWGFLEGKKTFFYLKAKLRKGRKS